MMILLPAKEIHFSDLTINEKSNLPTFEQREIIAIFESAPMDKPQIYPNIKDILIHVKVPEIKEQIRYSQMVIPTQPIPFTIEKRYGYILNGFNYLDSEYGFFLLTQKHNWRILK